MSHKVIVDTQLKMVAQINIHLLKNTALCIVLFQVALSYHRLPKLQIQVISLFIRQFKYLVHEHVEALGEDGSHKR